MATKKSSVTKKKATKPSVKKVAPIIETPAMGMSDFSKSLPKPTTRTSAQTFNLVIIALVVVALAMGFMRYKFILMPAVVNGSPIYSWQYVKALNQTAGKQVIDQLVVEKLISQEADQQKISLTKEEIDGEFDRLNKQFESAGGLDAFLTTQGLTKEDIQGQLELNLKVQKIVADKVSVTDEEVNSYFTENKAEYKDQAEADAKVSIKQMLADQALQEQVGTWIQDLRSKAKVTINLSGTN